MLDQKTIDTVKSTIPLLESVGSVFTNHFYQRMFTHNPELKDVFNLSHQRSGKQPVALMDAVLAYANHLDNPAVLLSAVERIAQKHTGFMVQPEQYAVVGEHLLKTIEELAPDAATPEVLEAWGKAYQLLADIFIQREQQIYQASATKRGGWQGTREFWVTEKKVESSEITSFVLEPVDVQPVADYLPGQYLSIYLDSDRLTHKEYRQYSLSDRPNGRSYRISVKREAGGVVSNHLHQHLQQGDILEVLPPAGDFKLEVEPDTPVVLLSAGVGLTPMLSMLNTLLEESHLASIHYLHACEDGRQHAFREYIEQQARQHFQLSSYTWYNRPLDEDRPGEDYQYQGLMELEPLRLQLLADRENVQFYFCGPVGFMQMINRQLREWGLVRLRSTMSYSGRTKLFEGVRGGYIPARAEDQALLGVVITSIISSAILSASTWGVVSSKSPVQCLILELAICPCPCGK